MPIKTQPNHQRLYISRKILQGFQIELTHAESHYILRVLRLKTYQQILVFNENDGEYLAQVSATKGYNCILNVLDKTNECEAYTSNISMCLGIISQHSMSQSISAVTQIGVNQIILVKSKYSQYGSISTQRYQKIIIESCEQSGRISVPKLLFFDSWQDLFVDIKNTYGTYNILFAHNKHTQHACQPNHYKNNLSTFICIGPEGGFHDDEVKLFTSNDAKQIQIGKNILRAEVASVVAASLFLI